MYRRELVMMGCLAAMVFAGIAALSFYFAHTLQHEARMVALDSLPGLVNTGEAIARLNDNWQTIQNVSDPMESPERNRLIQQIKANSTAALWQNYEKSIYDPKDRALFNETYALRSKYLLLLNDYYDVSAAQKTDEAKKFLKEKIAPAFQAYKSHAVQLFKLNQVAANRRAHSIIRASVWLPFITAAFCTGVFLLGVITGLKGAFGSLMLVHHWRKPLMDKNRQS